MITNGLPGRRSTHVRQIQRWKHEGGIPERTADRIACHVLGVHPAHIWPEWLA